MNGFGTVELSALCSASFSFMHRVSASEVHTSWKPMALIITFSLSRKKLLVNEIQEVRKSQEFFNETYEEMKNEMSSIKQTNKELQTENKYLKETLHGLKSQNEALELSVNKLQQYSRRPCLEFQGIPYTKDESTDERIREVAQKIGVDICNSDIDISHLLAQPTNQL